MKIINNKWIKILIAIVICILVFIATFSITVAVLKNKTDDEEEVIANSDEGSEEDKEDEELLKVIIDQVEEEQEETQSEETEKAPEATENNEVKPATKTPYYIKVNYQANVVTIYKQDNAGNYTVPIKAMVCSTGDYTPPCPKYPKTSYNVTGTKYRWGAMQGNVWAQYATQITGNILFHSVPLTARSNSSLEWWEYDKLGTRASLGCIRLTAADAKWIYDNIGAGTTVEFYASSNPGPLGKPEAKKVSSYPDNIKCWDPTDPASNNPWKTYVEPVNAEPVEENNNQNSETKPAENNTTVPENGSQNDSNNNTTQENKNDENNKTINNQENSNENKTTNENTSSNQKESENSNNTNTNTNTTMNRKNNDENNTQTNETVTNNNVIVNNITT